MRPASHGNQPIGAFVRSHFAPGQIEQQAGQHLDIAAHQVLWEREVTEEAQRQWASELAEKPFIGCCIGVTELKMQSIDQSGTSLVEILQAPLGFTNGLSDLAEVGGQRQVVVTPQDDGGDTAPIAIASSLSWP